MRIETSNAGGGSGSGVAAYSTLSAFPASSTDGTVAIALDTDILYAYNLATTSWLEVGGPGAAISLATLDSQAGNAKGASLTATGALSMQSASATNPGLVNTTTQTFAGTKTFSSTISGSVSGNAATVTTNANLTGPVTSVGNATAIADGALATTKVGGTNTQVMYIDGTGFMGGDAGFTFNDTTKAVTATTFIGALTGNASTATSATSATTASTVTTNANMTGDVTSVGNATTYNNTMPINKGGTGVTSVTSAPTASAWSGWDANKNYLANAYLAGYATTVAAAGTTTLTVASAQNQYFTGSTTQTVQLPVATTLANGQYYIITNNSTGVVTVQTSGANSLQVMAANSFAVVTCINTAGGTGTASWSVQYDLLSGAATQTTNTYSGDGSTVAFTLSTSPGTAANIQVYISGVYQQKSTYSVSGTTLTFSTAPPAGTNNVECMVLSPGAVTTLPNTATAVITSNTSATPSASIFLANATGGAITVTLPAASASTNVQYTVKKTDSSINTVTVARAGSDTIDGSTSKVILYQYNSVTVVSDGTSWWTI